MIFVTKKTILFSLFVLSHLITFSQIGVGIGYNIGSFTSPLRNMEVLTYEFNTAHPNYSKKFEFKDFYRGYSFLFCKNMDDNFFDGFELSWSQKIITSEAKGADNPSDEVYIRQVKVAYSTISAGYYGWIGDFAKVGVNYDMGSICSFSKKIAPEESFKNARWSKIFSKRGFFDTGFTIYFEVNIVHILKIRPYYQWTMISPILTSYKMSNFGLALYLGYEGKD